MIRYKLVSLHYENLQSYIAFPTRQLFLKNFIKFSKHLASPFV